MFWLAPHVTPPVPQRGSPRMFRVDWIERHISRVRPAQVLAFWVPVVVALTIWSLRVPGLAPAATLGLFAAGVLAWTLLEYALHRFAFHFVPRETSELQRDLAYLVHGVHHDWPHDADRLVMPPPVALALGVIVGLPMWLVLGTRHFPGVFAGLVAGYLWYDMTHYAMHHLRPRTRLGRLLRKNHMLHHFAQHGARFGVTTPLWDLVFGTYPRPGAREVGEQPTAR